MTLTLCGSLRFEQDIQWWHEKLALAGHVIYAMVALPSQKHGNTAWYTEDEKERLDLLHLAKIEESDAIFVVDTDNYIGDSTRREIRWARIRGKAIFYASSRGGVDYLTKGQDV